MDALPTPRSRVAIKHHLAAGLPWARALAAAGHELVGAGAPAEVLLQDLDIPGPHYRPLIDRYKADGATVLLYPHGLLVFHYWDGITEPYGAVDGLLVTAQGFADVYRKLGYPHPVHVVGWAHCEQRPFRPCARPREVLFAPAHPLETGPLVDWEAQLNRDAFAALRAVPGIALTVRHIHDLSWSGLDRVEGVTYVQGLPDGSTDDIDRADVVVASSTYAALSVARGAPTVQFGQDVRPSNGDHPGVERVFAATWEHWRHDVRYPFDLADGPAAELLATAAREPGPAARWRERFVGAPLDPARLSEVVEVAHAARALPAVRRVAVVGLAADVEADPALLAVYAEAVGPDDDATLVLLAPGREEAAVVPALQRAFAAARLSDEALPDLLLLPGAVTHWTALALAARAAGRLGRGPAEGPLAALPALDAAAVRGLLVA